MERSSGVLMAISSLPSKYGIGCLDESAYSFVDWLVSAGQTYWQILPVGATGWGDSPYKCYSAFAGNPFFIDLGEFVSAGFLTEDECEACASQDLSHVDYALLRKYRMKLLYKAFKSSDVCETAGFRAFVNGTVWVDNYALFMAIKDKLDGAELKDWPDDIRRREPEALANMTKDCAEQTLFHEFVQYTFFRQWRALKKYANEAGISIIGDIPIYVSDDSADFWAHPELFQTTDDERLASIAGCPPDAFSSTGQVWGNPLYDWPVHEQEGFRWWIQRMLASFELFDVVRIDHFRGFESYYCIDAVTRDASVGHWEQGPGMALFNALNQAIGQREIIVEDLGFITDAVRELVEETGYPNMRILEFGFDARDSGDAAAHQPHNYPANSVAYSGTHDNQTLQSWYETITDEERATVRAYLCDDCTEATRLNEALIALIERSAAKLCVVPLQDWLGLDDTARMNVPSTVGNNWAWRARADQITPQLAARMAQHAALFGRTPKAGRAEESTSAAQ